MEKNTLFVRILSIGTAVVAAGICGIIFLGQLSSLGTDEPFSKIELILGSVFLTITLCSYFIGSHYWNVYKKLKGAGSFETVPGLAASFRMLNLVAIVALFLTFSAVSAILVGMLVRIYNGYPLLG